MDRHTNIRRFVARALLAATPVLAVGVTSGTAAAAKDGDVEARGRCSASSTCRGVITV